MSNSDDETFATLTVQLHQQYVELDGIVDKLTQGPLESVDSIADQMKKIKRTEGALGPLRDRFIESKRSLSDHLQTVTDQTIVLVTQLMPKLAQLEKTTIDSAKRLFPQVQQNVRAVQMQNAYVTTKR